MSDEFEFLGLDKKLRTTMKYLVTLFLLIVCIGCNTNRTGYECYSCDREVALLAKTCPHCGQTLENATPRKIGELHEDITTDEIIKRVNSTGWITDEQAESLSKVDGILGLEGLTSLTDKQAESLSKVPDLWLDGLTSITDEQAESLSKVETLIISEDLQPLINKYKNQ